MTVDKVALDPFDPFDPWAYCACGHVWMRHDIEEYTGDGSETCCVDGCPQVGCPGRREEPACGREDYALALIVTITEEELGLSLTPWQVQVLRWAYSGGTLQPLRHKGIAVRRAP
jgi:hypothetical protein